MKLIDLHRTLGDLVEGWGNDTVLINGEGVSKVIAEKAYPLDLDSSFIGEAIENDPKVVTNIVGRTPVEKENKTETKHIISSVMNERYEVVFFDSSKIYASEGIIGIDENGETYQGSSSAFPLCGMYLTRQQSIELANMMIDRWIDYKNKAIRGFIDISKRNKGNEK